VVSQDAIDRLANVTQDIADQFHSPPVGAGGGVSRGESRAAEPLSCFGNPPHLSLRRSRSDPHSIPQRKRGSLAAKS
jgi:hypothetical protein